jgi:hypothetical protein
VIFCLYFYLTGLCRNRLLANPERDYSQDNEKNRQDDGKLKHRFFHTPSGPIHGIRLAEDTSQPPATNLKQNNQYQGYRQYYLSYT